MPGVAAVKYWLGVGGFAGDYWLVGFGFYCAGMMPGCVVTWVGRGASPLLGYRAGRVCGPDESRGLFPLVWFPYGDGSIVLVCWFCCSGCSFLSCVIRLRITPFLFRVCCSLVLSYLCYSLAYNTHLLWCVLVPLVVVLSSGAVAFAFHLYVLPNT